MLKMEILGFQKLRDVWHAKYRVYFKSLARVIGYSNNYIMHSYGAIGLENGTPLFIFLMENDKGMYALNRKIRKNGKVFRKLVFFDMSHLVNKTDKKNILKHINLYLKEQKFDGVYINNDEAWLCNGLRDIGFKKIAIRKP